MERDIMTIDKNLEGAWRICENINGYLETQVYYFYTKKDAIKKFRQYKTNIIKKYMLKYIIIICLFLNGCTTYKHNQLQKEIIKKQQSWLNI
jgi:hypothetical protein